MLICCKVNLCDFKFWGGALEGVQRAIENGVEEQFFKALEKIMIEDYYCASHIPTETDVNSIAWLHCDSVIDELISCKE